MLEAQSTCTALFHSICDFLLAYHASSEACINNHAFKLISPGTCVLFFVPRQAAGGIEYVPAGQVELLYWQLVEPAVEYRPEVQATHSSAVQS